MGAPRLVPKDDLATPVPNLSSGDSRVRLADINGDGLADVVLFSSGYFEYWPSRGGGHFSESRKMTAAPRFPYPFDPARVFIIDINGDGLADVVFVGYDEVTYWINQSGNSFSAPQTIRYTPPTSRADTLRIADMSGTGTAGLLWTSPYPDYRYLDFTGDVKPGLLSRIDNGLGRVTAIEYATSTAEARRDREQGEPWTSFLPFPVQVVSAVTVDDSISGLHNVTRYVITKATTTDIGVNSTDSADPSRLKKAMIRFLRVALSFITTPKLRDGRPFPIPSFGVA